MDTTPEAVINQLRAQKTRRESVAEYTKNLASKYINVCEWLQDRGEHTVVSDDCATISVNAASWAGVNTLNVYLDVHDPLQRLGQDDHRIALGSMYSKNDTLYICSANDSSPNNEGIPISRLTIDHGATVEFLRYSMTPEQKLIWSTYREVETTFDSTDT